MIKPEVTLIRPQLKAPRAGAVAGIVFSILLIIGLVIVRLTIPANPQDAGSWLSGGRKKVTLALNLMPFAGIAFLWFIGVLRDRIGASRTVFLRRSFSAAAFCFLP
jgi:hypothetical protein